MFSFTRYLPLLDPEKFLDIAFYQELEKIGYQQVLLGGTGASDLAGLARSLKEHTRLTVCLYPSGPDSVTEAADVIILPDVMNSNSHYARPFGSGSVATAMNIATQSARKQARQGIPLEYVSVAYFIMGNSTARWFYDAYLVPQPKLIYAYANYAHMLGYRYLALDYEDPELSINPKLIKLLKTLPGLQLVVSDEFTPERAEEAVSLGCDVVITPSDVYEEASDPLALAHTFYNRLLKP